MDGDVGFSEKRQTRHPLRFETVGDQVEQSCTSTLVCCRDGVSQKSLVVEFRRIAVIELEDAVFANHVG